MRAWQVLSAINKTAVQSVKDFWHELHRDFRGEIREMQRQRREADRLWLSPEELNYYDGWRGKINGHYGHSPVTYSHTPVNKKPEAPPPTMGLPPKELLDKPLSRSKDPALDKLGHVTGDGF